VATAKFIHNLHAIELVYNTIHVVLNASKFCVVVTSYIDLSKTLNIKFTIDVLIHVSLYSENYAA